MFLQPQAKMEANPDFRIRSAGVEDCDGDVGGTQNCIVHYLNNTCFNTLCHTSTLLYIFSEIK